MLRKSREGRTGPLRQNLIVEALEDRTLPDGVVTAVLDPATGLLQVTGDGRDNQFTIAPSGPDQIRVFGDLGTATSVNGGASADFPLSAVTDVRVALPEGKD